ncbi:MAG: hypothetical protein IT249_19510 [Chitinophagaceae bacterium]|nr:hypothetical protein [Chitinophagaceae bacterium]
MKRKKYFLEEETLDKDGIVRAKRCTKVNIVNLIEGMKESNKVILWTTTTQF